TMVAEGAPPPLKVCFAYPDRPGQYLEEPRAAHMLEHVVKPLVRLIGAAEVSTVSNRMKEHALYRDVTAMARQGIATRKFAASGKHMATMAGYAGCVTITLRECDYWPHRNSNIFEWLKFAHWLRHARGERVVFIRDTRFANSPVDDWETCRAAASDLELR